MVDWVYTDDAVDALIKAVDQPSGVGQAIEICSGQTVTIRHTVELLASVIGTDGRPDYNAVPDRPIDPAQIGDPRAAHHRIGWRPSIGLSDGLRKTAEWYSMKTQLIFAPWH